MGLFDKFKKKTETAPAAAVEIKGIAAPLSGTVVAQGDLNDPVFSQGIMGMTLGIEPGEDGRVYSPVSGTVSMVFPTGHAVGLKADNGTEVLIHIGIDTVSMNGEGFNLAVKDGNTVTQGDLLVTFDPALVRSRKLDAVVMVILTDPAGHTYQPTEKNGQIAQGEALFTE